ncbi:ABC transporter ATP-binding protein [Pseudogulbenkiania subflava]|uniref:NitT/TauT family transport system ATP-binding protein n=1 Tax=Pseudogulbenkiania subflava DSM 22618 TaxID=1123014 RepID=A0A1Y6CA51_9NEIS|nr:ABC transporter ATP-binding protein [Pseudogulbenkiania subflava]SMF53908.1 NitT/TauT family transport system ATP-binding protein [Pseudogulbenkiania subflava DSM 22618]
MSHPRITLEHVSKQFAAPGAGRTAVLDNVSLTVNEGEFVCLLGPSGCGKSTILNLVAGFEQPDHGRVLLDHRPISEPGPERGMVFQQPMLFPWLTVRDNVTFGPRMTGADKASYQADAERYLQLVGLQDFAEHYPWQLSGGMRQRAALARAWLPKPQTLLMDEPFGALDAQTRLAMQELLTDIWQRTRTTILFVTHDVDEALFLADRVLVMSARPGQIRESLTVPFARPRNPEELLTDSAYGQLKRDILHAVREEAAKSLGLQPA